MSHEYRALSDITQGLRQLQTRSAGERALTRVIVMAGCAVDKANERCVRRVNRLVSQSLQFCFSALHG